MVQSGNLLVEYRPCDIYVQRVPNMSRGKLLRGPHIENNNTTVSVIQDDFRLGRLNIHDFKIHLHAL